MSLAATSTSPVGMSAFSVPAGRFRTLPSTRITHSERSFSACLKAGRVRVDHDLRQPVVIAQIDEQEPAVIADAVAPAGEARGLADVARAERAAGMGAIAMH